MTYAYQQSRGFFAQAPEGVESLAAEELAELGATAVHAAYRGVRFEADTKALYRITYTARCITRVLAPLIAFRCHTYEYLYRRAAQVEWSRIFEPHHRFAVLANASNSRLRHSQYAALSVKDAIVDHFRQRLGRRPDVDKENPDLRINLHLESNLATLSLDVSGESLHRRGYRVESLEATMQETLAATVIRLTAWEGSSPLRDPMCGSGTLLSEALMRYCRIPSGFLRTRFGFQFLPDFDASLWKRVREEEDRKIRGLPEGLIAGSDSSPRAVQASRSNLSRLPCGHAVSLEVRDFREIPALENTTIVCDPPYGVRLNKGQDLGGLYKALGDFLKRRCKGSTAFVYFGNREMISQVGLRPSWKVALKAGGLDGRLAKYEVY